MEFAINLSLLQESEKYSIDEWKERTKTWDWPLLMLINSIGQTPFEDRHKVAEALVDMETDERIESVDLVQKTIDVASLSEAAFDRLVTSVQLNIEEGVYKFNDENI